MYCNIVFMIDIFVISKITQYRYYVIAITDVRSLGLSTKWRTLMIKKTMKVRENTFRKLEDPFENGAAKKYVFYVKVDDVAEGIPMATNPRDQKLTSGVATAIKESLLSNDGYFHLKNRGIVLSAESVHYNNKEKIATIIFSDELSHGNIDGGHTYKIVCEHKGENLEQYVQFEVMTGVEDIIENLAEARNTSVIKLQQEDGKSYSSIHTIRGVLRPAFQMAVDDDILVKNPFGFQLAGVLVNDAVTREVIYKDQMRKFLKFVHDDVAYCKYYEVVYILFHTGMRISEFCGLTLKDIDLEKMTVNIDHQLQRTSDMRYIIETTKTDAGTRVLPITEDVAEMFQAIIEDRNASKVEKDIDGYSGFLFYDDNGMPLVAMHWQHRFNHMVGRYNDIYRVQMPNITLHVCRHTYCSNMATPTLSTV